MTPFAAAHQRCLTLTAFVMPLKKPARVRPKVYTQHRLLLRQQAVGTWWRHHFALRAEMQRHQAMQLCKPSEAQSNQQTFSAHAQLHCCASGVSLPEQEDLQGYYTFYTLESEQNGDIRINAVRKVGQKWLCRCRWTAGWSVQALSYSRMD